MHDEERGAEEKVPLGQSVQLSEPAVGENEPDSHESHDVAGFATMVPAGQSEQLGASTMLEYVTGPQGGHEL